MALTKSEGTGLLLAFFEAYPVTAMPYRIRDTVAELYGPEDADRPILGAFVPGGTHGPNQVDLVIARHKDGADFVRTVRHELFGHFGINTFTPDEKRALLEGIEAGKDQSSMYTTWRAVRRDYEDAPVQLQAEEVFALVCEDVEPGDHLQVPQVQERGAEAFYATCVENSRRMQLSDLHRITEMVAHGLHDWTRAQRNFPDQSSQFKKDTVMEPKKPFHETVAEKLIEQMKQGMAPWQKPWQPGDPGAVMPVNATTGKRYKGINAIHLMSQGYTDQRWLTYKQASAVNAQVRKGEKGTAIQYWKYDDEETKRDENGKPVLDTKAEPVKQSVKLERPRVFYATVFNAEQVDGLPELAPRKQHEWNAVDRAEQILQASGAVIKHGEQSRAFYRPATDSIHLPDKSQFLTADNYYATALHELGHWTGHESRLDRDLAHPFSSQGYAKEELRAEIASMILGDELGIGHDPGQHVAYVASWIKALQEDPREIFHAASDAEKIQKFVLAFEQQQRQQQDRQQTPALTLTVDVAEVLKSADVDSSHYRTYQGDSLEGALSSRGLGTVGSITGVDPERFYEVAHDRLSPVFGIYPGHTDTDNAYLERKGLAQEFANKAEQLQHAATQEVAMKQPTLEGIDGRLVDRLVDSGTMSREDADLTSALRDFKVGSPITHEVDIQILNDAAQKAIGAVLPSDSTGQAEVVGMVEHEGQILPAEEPGERPEVFHGYAPRADVIDDAFVLVGTAPTATTAQELADRLALIDAHAQVNENEKAVKLARLEEQRVRRDPNSAGEDISAAKEARKDAEFKAAFNDLDLQRRIAEIQGGQHGQATSAPPQAPTPGVKTFLDVPFKEKNEAKALGAKWDRNELAWYVAPGADLAPFAKWSKQAGFEAVSASTPVQATHVPEPCQDTASERVYLAVPYGEHVAARAAGALWDKTAKSWFAGPSADEAKLERWKPDNAVAQQGPAMTPREELAEAMRSLDLFVGSNAEGDHPMMDGKRHRVPVDSDKAGEKSGFYVAHEDGRPAGYIKNNRTGVDMRWKAKGYALDADQKAQMQAESASRMQARESEQAKAQEQAAQRVEKQLAGLVPPVQPTAYMLAKGLQPQAGVMTDREGEKTYIPATDAEGKQWTMQYIDGDGTKRFAKDSRKEGCFHAVGGLEALAKAPALVIGEGYATAGSLSQTLGFATVAAFDSGNLLPVAKALHAKFPDKPIVIAGDDDRHLEATQGVNPGRSKAEEAAKAVGGKLLLPIFAPGEASYTKELPPVTPQVYRKHLSATKRLEDAKDLPVGDLYALRSELKDAQLSVPQLTALAAMKQFTDFNDLAMKSELGQDGLRRQVNSIVDAVVEKSQVRTEQRVEQQDKKQVLRRDEKAVAPDRPRRAAKIG